MKITHLQIKDELLPALNKLEAVQLNGLVQLPAKVAYAMGRCYSILTTHLKEYHKAKSELIEQYAQKDENGKYKTVKVDNLNEYEFKEGQKPVFIEKVKALDKTEIEWLPYRIPKPELLTINNFPITLYAILEQYDMITELHLQDANKIKVLN